MKTMKKVVLAVALTAMASGAMADVTDPLTTTNNTAYCSNAHTIIGFMDNDATPAHSTNSVMADDINKACVGFIASHICTVPLYMSKNIGDGKATCTPGSSVMQPTGVSATIDGNTEAIAFTNGGKGSFTDSTGQTHNVIFSTPGKMQVVIDSKVS